MRKSLKKNVDTSYADQLKSKINEESRSYISKSIAFAKYIEDFKSSQDFRQRDIGEKLGINESQISRWLSGFHNLTIKSILKLESVCNINILNPEIWNKENKRPATVDFSASALLTTTKVSIGEKQIPAANNLTCKIVTFTSTQRLQRVENRLSYAK